MDDSGTLLAARRTPPSRQSSNLADRRKVPRRARQRVLCLAQTRALVQAFDPKDKQAEQRITRFAHDMGGSQGSGDNH